MRTKSDVAMIKQATIWWLSDPDSGIEDVLKLVPDHLHTVFRAVADHFIKLGPPLNDCKDAAIAATEDDYKVLIARIRLGINS